MMWGLLLYLICLPIELASAIVRGTVLIFLVFLPLAPMLEQISPANSVGITLTYILLVFIGVLTVGPILWSVATLIGFPGGGTLTRRELGAGTPTSDDEILFDPCLHNIQSQHPHVKGPRRWYVIDNQGSMNAYVIGTTLYVETGLLQSVYLEAVLAHELGHLNSLDGRLMLALRRFMVPFMYKLSDRLGVAADQYKRQFEKFTPVFSRNSSAYTSFGCASLIVLSIVNLLRRVLLFSGGGFSSRLIRPALPAFLRSREYQADQYAAQLDYHIPLAGYLSTYAQANDVAIPYYSNTHPYVRERISRLKNYTPKPLSYRGPAWLKPTTFVSTASALVLMSGAAFVIIGIQRGVFTLPEQLGGTMRVTEAPVPTRSIIINTELGIAHVRVKGVAPQMLRVRQKPTLDAAIVARIPEASVVERLEQVGDGENQWYHIRTGQIEGWASAHYFEDAP